MRYPKEVRTVLNIGRVVTLLALVSLLLVPVEPGQAGTRNSQLHVRIVRDVHGGKDWGPLFEFSLGRAHRVVAVGRLRGWGEQPAVFDIRPVPEGADPFAANWEDPIGLIAADRTISSLEFSQRDLRSANGWKWKAYCAFDYGEPEDYYLGDTRGPARAVQLILERCPPSGGEQTAAPRWSP